MPLALPDPAPAIAALQALVLQHVPWQHGGLDPTTGLDCYGVVHYAFALIGIALPAIVEAGAECFSIVPPPYQAWDVVLGCPRSGSAAARHLGLLLSPWDGFHCAVASNGVARFTLAQPFWRHIFRHALRFQEFLVCE